MTAVEAYTYNADIVCPDCIIKRFGDDIEPAVVATGNAETVLDLAATARGIDRYDERSFDSGDFPKVVFGNQLNDDPDAGCEHCGDCHEPLGHEPADCYRPFA